jgi:Ras-related protein Rab-5C
MMPHDEGVSFKVVLLGDVGVGKTSILNRQLGNAFQVEVRPTLGVHHCQAFVDCRGSRMELRIWDITGHDSYSSLVPVYARGASAAIVVASIIAIESIEHINLWAAYLNQACLTPPPVIVAINKMDMRDSAPITEQQIFQRLSGSYEAVMFVSAKTNEGIGDLFLTAATEISNRFQGSTEVIALNKEKKGCC